MMLPGWVNIAAVAYAVWMLIVTARVLYKGDSNRATAIGIYTLCIIQLLT